MCRAPQRPPSHDYYIFSWRVCAPNKLCPSRVAAVLRPSCVRAINFWQPRCPLLFSSPLFYVSATEWRKVAVIRLEVFFELDADICSPSSNIEPWTRRICQAVPFPPLPFSSCPSSRCGDPCSLGVGLQEHGRTLETSFAFCSQFCHRCLLGWPWYQFCRRANTSVLSASSPQLSFPFTQICVGQKSRVD